LEAFKNEEHVNLNASECEFALDDAELDDADEA
jgi:hypothetical protein